MNRKQRSNKEIMLLIVFAAIVCLGVLNAEALLTVIKSFIGMLKPFIVGTAIAFVLNLPMKYIEENWLKALPEKWRGSKRSIGIVLSLLFFVLVISFVVISVIPQMGRTLNQLAQKSRYFLRML